MFVFSARLCGGGNNFQELFTIVFRTRPRLAPRQCESECIRLLCYDNFKRLITSHSAGEICFCIQILDNALRECFCGLTRLRANFMARKNRRAENHRRSRWIIWSLQLISILCSFPPLSNPYTCANAPQHLLSSLWSQFFGLFCWLRASQVFILCR